jgi:Spy/CpxP family protein refolding chaperone
MRRIIAISLLALGLMGGYAMPSYAQAPAPAQNDLPQRPKLNLTSAQKEQMLALRESTRQKIQAVLTPEQRRQYESATLAGIPRRQVMKSLNLTEAQKQEMRAIREQSRQQRLSILTPEQRAQLEQFRQNRPSRRPPL